MSPTNPLFRLFQFAAASEVVKKVLVVFNGFTDGKLFPSLVPVT